VSPVLYTGRYWIHGNTINRKPPFISLYIFNILSNYLVARKYPKKIRHGLREKTEALSEELMNIQKKCGTLLKKIDKVENVADNKTDGQK
jgi:hypothetical protein